MKALIFLSFILTIFTGDKLDPKDKVYITFKETSGQPNTDPSYAKGILQEYIKNKTSLVLVNSPDGSDFTFVLSVYEKGNTNMGKIDIVQTGTDKAIFQSTWIQGKPKMYFGYSAVKHSIGTIFNKQILGKYPHIEADNRP